jgi:hypothetical protein
MGPRLVLLLLALMLLPLASGCSTYRDVPLRQSGGEVAVGSEAREADAGLRVGDRVRLRLRDGCLIRGRLAAVAGGAFIVSVAREVPRQDEEFGVITAPDPCRPVPGDRQVAVPAEDVVAAERLRFSTGRSLLLGLGASAIAASVFVALVLASMGS